MIKIGGSDSILIDCHTHVWDDFAGQRLGYCILEPTSYGKVRMGNQIKQLLTPENCDNNVRVEVLLGYMEMLDMDRAVIIQNPCYGDQRDYVRKIINNYPGRFAGIGMIDPRNRDSLEEEIDILTAEYGFRGVKIEVPDTPFEMDHPGYDLLWRKILECDTMIVIYMGWGSGPYDFNLERLKKVLKKYPDIKMVLPHLGISRLWDLNQKYPFSVLQETLQLLDINSENLWFDISHIQIFDDEYPYPRSREILRVVKNTCGMDRIMWGTDFPTVLKQCTYRQCLDLITRHCDFLDEADLEMLLGLNAQRVYFGQK